MENSFIQLLEADKIYNLNKYTTGLRVRLRNVYDRSVGNINFVIPPFHNCQVIVEEQYDVSYFNFTTQQEDLKTSLNLSLISSLATINSIIFEYSSNRKGLYEDALQWEVCYIE